jgi:hypothetical protein
MGIFPWSLQAQASSPLVLQPVRLSLVTRREWGLWDARSACCHPTFSFSPSSSSRRYRLATRSDPQRGTSSHRVHTDLDASHPHQRRVSRKPITHPYLILGVDESTP